MKQNPEKAFPGKGKFRNEEVYQLKMKISQLEEEDGILKKQWVSL